jgi:hypothetical protein
VGRVQVWANHPEVVGALRAYLDDMATELHEIQDDAELAASGSNGSLLVAQAGPRLTAQQRFLRGPFILIDPHRESPRALAERAYAVVTSVPEAGLAVDRYFTHRQLVDELVGRRGSPRRCSRCGRGFDSQKVRAGSPARRFVRFGSIALCGTCVEQLRSLLRQAESAVVEADG